MSSPAQCLANARNAQLSTGPKSPDGKATVASNGVTHGLFAAYNRLAPDQTARVDRFFKILHDGIPLQCEAFEEVVRRFAIAHYRCQLHQEMEASFLRSAICNELQNPDTLALIEMAGDGIVLGRAIERDSAGPKVFAKLLRYEAQVQREFKRAEEAYHQAREVLANLRRRLKPPSPKAHPEPVSQTPRNARCPCGSGLKHKRCCGTAATPSTQSTYTKEMPGFGFALYPAPIRP